MHAQYTCMGLKQCNLKKCPFAELMAEAFKHLFQQDPGSKVLRVQSKVRTWKYCAWKHRSLFGNKCSG